MSPMRFFASLFLSASLLFVNSGFATISAQIKLIGKIVSFDEKTVHLKSGNRVFFIAKIDLKYPSYKVGDELEIEMTKGKLNGLSSERAKQ
jgi:hypothetical protein